MSGVRVFFTLNPRFHTIPLYIIIDLDPVTWASSSSFKRRARPENLRRQTVPPKFRQTLQHLTGLGVSRRNRPPPLCRLPSVNHGNAEVWVAGRETPGDHKSGWLGEQVQWEGLAEEAQILAAARESARLNHRCRFRHRCVVIL